MKRTSLAIPEIALISGTRAVLGAGLGLLLGERLKTGQRRALGWGMLAVGVLTTIPIAIQLFGSRSVKAASVEHNGRHASNRHSNARPYSARKNKRRTRVTA